MNPLANAEIQRIASDLLTGFREEWEWMALAATAADIDLYEEVGKGHGLRYVAIEVVRLAEERGLTEMLLREAALQRPHKASIQALVARYGLAPAPMVNVRVMTESGLPRALAPSERSAYEAMVLREAGTAKPGDWRRQMASREVAVCQVLFRGDATGTGFLVGPDIVMSNWHVFESPASGALGPIGDYAVRFDYRAAEGAAPASLGKLVEINATAGYLASSPKNKFDYVLVKLAAKVGAEALKPLGERGWLRPATREVGKLEPIFVLQYPNTRTLELAVGPVVGWVEKFEHQIYAHYANTDHGSSGSPCFTFKWELAAIHHQADPVNAQGPNRAVAMTAVLQDMTANGTLSLIPEIV